MNRLKIFFFGTPDFAIPTLSAIQNAGFEIAGVVSQPDRPKRRGLKLSPTPVKAFAMENDLLVLQPESLKEDPAIETIKSRKPDFLVVVAYGKILPITVLEIPRIGCVNLHGSLLPKYRGAAPIQRAIMAGETKTGVTTMLMDEGMDTGDMLLRREIPITPGDTAGSMNDVLARLGADLMAATLKGLADRSIRPKKQDHEKATYAPKIEKNDAFIDWNEPANAIDRKIRGLSPAPGAAAKFAGKRVKILMSSVEDKLGPPGKPGEVLQVGENGILVSAGENSVVISKIQPENKRVMSGFEFSLGHKIAKGDFFGAIRL